MPRFSLLYEQWITVTWLDGKTSQVALLELFSKSHEIRAISEELATQSFAELRLALAILHKSVRGPLTRKEWLIYWKEFPEKSVLNYLHGSEDCFDLFDPNFPFMQVANLQAVSGGYSTLLRFIGDVPNNAQFQVNRSGRSVESLSFAEAARWLVHVHAFDDAGIKTGAVGDANVKRGKGYGSGFGWAGNLGGIFLQGENLRETLLLNLVPICGSDARELLLDEVDVSVISRPVAGYERRDLTSQGLDYSTRKVGAELVHEVRGGMVAMYTWQSRRVRLVHEGDRVVGVVLSIGDRRTPQNGFRVEPMSAWRLNVKLSKECGQSVYMPVKHIPGIAFWQSLTSMLPSQSRKNSTEWDAPTHITPANLAFVGAMADEIGVGRSLKVATVGVKYGDDGTTVVDTMYDSVDLRIPMLSEWSKPYSAVLQTNVGKTIAAIEAYADFEQNLTHSSFPMTKLKRGTKSPVDNVRDTATRAAVHAIDGSFRQWLAGLSPEGDETKQVEQAALEEGLWHRHCIQVMRGLCDARMQRLSQAELVGRRVAAKDVPRLAGPPILVKMGEAFWINASVAESIFISRINKIFVKAHQSNVEEGCDA